MRARNYLDIAEHLDAKGDVLTQGRLNPTDLFPTSFSVADFYRAAALGHGLTGMLLPSSYELVPIADPPVDVTELERKHHNRVSTLQARLRRARTVNGHLSSALDLADIRIAQLEANEKVLIDQIQRLTAERDGLAAEVLDFLAERRSQAVESAPERPPATIIKDLLHLTTDDVMYENHHRVDRLWRKDGQWLYHPADDTWQEGYQPVPFVPGTEFGVRVFA